MLIILPSQLLPSSATGPDAISDEFLECIENLAIAHRKGLHIVSASPALVGRLKSRLSTDAIGIFRQIVSKYHQQAALIAFVTDYIMVEMRTDGVVTRTREGDKQVFGVPFGMLTAFSMVQPARLVVEDSTDRDIYIRVTRSFLTFRRDIKYLSLQLHAFGGGGSSTADQFKDHAAYGPTLTIVDSDMKSPDASLGSTAASVKSCADDIAATTVSAVDVLPAHELENLLPGELVEECIGADDSAAMKTSWRDIADNYMTCSEPHRYLDLKEGVRHWDLSRWRGTSSEDYMRKATSGSTSQGSCACDHATSKRENCTQIHIAGFGSALLSRVADRLARLTPHKLGELFWNGTFGGRSIWELLCTRILSWGIAYHRTRV